MRRPSDRLINLFGALALGVTDRTRSAIRNELALGGEATAALIVIGHQNGLSINQLGSVLDLSQPGTVRLVDRLTAEGLVARDAVVKDKRMIALSLTAPGRKKRDTLLRRRREVIAEILALIGDEDQAVLERIAMKILGRLPDDAVSATRICRFCDEGRCASCPMDAFGTIA